MLLGVRECLPCEQAFVSLARQNCLYKRCRTEGDTINASRFEAIYVATCSPLAIAEAYKEISVHTGLVLSRWLDLRFHGEQ